LIEVLRKLHAEDEINWVEALPRALRFIHDRVGEGGLSPYKILMGRERPLAGLPYTPDRECQEAQDYFDQIEELDRLVADNLDSEHNMAQSRHNARIRSRPEFKVGDLVWVMKPKPIGGHKTQTYWTGPTTILSRSGESSFTIATRNEGMRAVHIAQLKPYFDDLLEGGVPLHHFRPENRDPPVGTPAIEEILSHRTEPGGMIWFLVRWSGSSAEQDSWLSLVECITMGDRAWVPYCLGRGIGSIPVGALAETVEVQSATL
jgi:hypothetical protein